MALIEISFTMTERAWKVLQRKVEQDKAIHKPGIFISSHNVKIGCREVEGSWVSIRISDSREIGEEFEQIGICKDYPVFSDRESLFIIHEFSDLTFDLAQENGSTIIFRELVRYG